MCIYVDIDVFICYLYILCVLDLLKLSNFVLLSLMSHCSNTPRKGRALHWRRVFALDLVEDCVSKTYNTQVHT